MFLGGGVGVVHVEAEEKTQLLPALLLLLLQRPSPSEVGGEQERGERLELPRLQQARPRVWFQPERLERKMKIN